MTVPWTFADELARFGPDSPPFRGGLSAARRYCADLTQRHNENFTVVSLLLPRRLVPHFQAVYAYCRWADDLADATSGGDETLSLLAWWRGELHRCCDGEPQHPITLALRETIRRFAIPPTPFLDLLLAFEQDQRVKEYDTFEQLLGYCRHSANPVGRIVLHLFECFDDGRAALSDEVCTGLQLANFWQDVDRDLTLGRVYLPKEDRERFGYSESDLRARRFTPTFAVLMRFQVERTRGHFGRGEALIAKLPREYRIDVDLFLRGGRAVLDAIEQVQYDVWTRRPEVTKGRKATLILRAVFAHWVQPSLR